MFEGSSHTIDCPAACGHRSCMRIAYLGSADVGNVRTRDSLDILIPGPDGNLFATFAAGHGHDRTALVRAPLVAVLPPSLPHSLADHAGSSTLILSIAARFFADVARAAVHCDDLTLVEPHASADALIREVGNAVDRDVRSLDRLDDGYVKSLAAVLSAHVAQHYVAAQGARMAPTGGLAAHKMRCVRSYVTDHLGQAIRVDQLADAVHLSAFHFARMFKQSTGQSPHLYVLMQRVERAKELLSESDLPLVDVAADVGFRTQGHFTTVFHRYSGFTPRMYRLQARDRC
ncbi:MAG TPA: AraC family transcriptional regulator [Albitalea sp.]|jgi:AraC family transcriptional regulator|nr:AraC family transcriptional regulator [Albitalea sp.]